MSTGVSELAADKYRRILEAAYCEFAAYDYQHASSNRIVRRAGVAKGMLFYYFKSKEALFRHLVEHGLTVLEKEFFSRLDDSEPDLIARYRRFAKLKLECYGKVPHIVNFFAAVHLRNDLARFPELEAKVNEAQRRQTQKLYHHIDTSRFRQDLAAERLIQLVGWATAGFQLELTARLKQQGLPAPGDPAPFQDEMAAFEAFLDTLKQVIYGGDDDTGDCR